MAGDRAAKHGEAALPRGKAGVTGWKRPCQSDGRSENRRIPPTYYKFKAGWDVSMNIGMRYSSGNMCILRVRWLVVAWLLFFVAASYGASETWVTTGTTPNWSGTSNWSGGAAPGATSGTANTDVATFSTGPGTYGTAGSPILIDQATQNFGGILFGASAGNYYLGSAAGNAMFLTSSGTIQILSTLATSGVETINAPLVLEGAGATYNFSNNSGSGTLNIGGAITGDATGITTLALAGTNTNLNMLSGNLSNGLATSLGVTQSGPGVWALSGSNNYSGATNITAGTLVLESSTANTVGGVCYALGGSTTATLGGSTSGTSTLELLTNANNIILRPSQVIETRYGGNFNFAVGNNGSGTGNTVILANVNQLGAAGASYPTYSISGSNDYALQMGSGISGTGTVDFYDDDILNVISPGVTLLIPGGMAVNYSSAYTLAFGGVGNSVVGALSQSGTYACNLSKSGSGTLTLIGACNFTGTTTISAGTLQLGNGTPGDDGTISNNSPIEDAGTVEFDRYGGSSYSGVISGTGAVVMEGGGSQTLSGTDAYTGGTTVSSGTLIFGSQAAPGTYNIASGAILDLGPGAVLSSTATTFTGSGTLELSNTSATIAFGGAGYGLETVSMSAGGLVWITGSSSVVASSNYDGTWNTNDASLRVDVGSTINFVETGASGLATVDAVTGAGTIESGYDGARTIEIGVAGSSGTFSGVFADNTVQSGTLALIKTGSGKQVLTGSNTYSGATAINGGILEVDNALHSGSVTVGAGATLGGTGTIYGPVTLTWGGELEAGNSLTLAGGVTLSQTNGTTMAVNFANTSGSLAVSNPEQLPGGTITISGTISIQVNVQSGNLTPGGYVLVSGGTATSGSAAVILNGAPGYYATLDSSHPGQLILDIMPVAFPGAEGYGAIATGGRGGTVYHVTNLNDSGPGSFRDAVSQSNRTVVFDVGGIIYMQSPIYVSSNITIAGQTAPGQGISTYGQTVYLTSAAGVGNSNIIVRHMRFREGFQEDGTSWSLALVPSHTVILDHCSMEIGDWQTLSITLNTTTGEQPTNITVQNCIVGASIGEQLGCLDWAPINLTFHHNLFIDNGGRDPKVEGNSQIINDVVYNFNLGLYGDGTEQCDFIGNYHINGPDTNEPFNQGMNFRGDTTGVFYATGNYWDNSQNGTLQGVPLVAGTEYSWNPVISTTPICYPTIPVTVDTAQLAYYKVVSGAGASLSRDPLDDVLISHVTSLGTLGPGGQLGISYVPGLYLAHNVQNVSNPSSVPITGNPLPSWSIAGGTAPIDTDDDGIPDDWEIANGLSAYSGTAGNTVTASGYTNLELYLNWMAQPHARITENATLDTDLSQYTAAFTSQSPVFALSGAFGGTVLLLSDGHTAQFFPTSNYAGMGGYSYTVTGRDGTVMSGTFGILINPPPVYVTWKGDGSSNAWNTSALNWLNGTTATAFTYGANVTFDNTGSNSPAINLTQGADPSSITVNSGINYTLGGTGYLYGPMSLTKSGTGTLNIGPTLVSSTAVTVSGSYEVTLPSTAGIQTGMGVWGMTYTGAYIPDLTTVSSVVDSTHLILSNAARSSGTTVLGFCMPNKFSGGVVLNSGTIAFGNVDGNQFGLGGDAVTMNGGTLQMYDAGLGNPGSGELPDNLIVNGTANLDAAQRCQLFGDVTGSGTLTLSIPSVRTEIEGDWSGFAGQLNTVTTSSEGDLRLWSTTGMADASINLGPNIVAYYYPYYGSSFTFGIGALSGSATSSILKGGDWAGAPFIWSVGSLNTNATYMGSITEDATNTITGITKVGTGSWTLSGPCTYVGPTLVQSGTLILSGSMNGTSSVEVSGSACMNLINGHIVSPTVTIDAYGFMNACGSITGAVANNGMLTVLTGSNLTIAGNMTNAGTMVLSSSSSLSVTGIFTNDGTLDFIDAAGSLPANMVNNGIVLTSSILKTQPSVITSSSSGLNVSLQTYTNHHYQLQKTASLTSPSWQNVGPAQPGTGGTLTLIDPAGITGSTGIYRVFVTAP